MAVTWYDGSGSGTDASGTAIRARVFSSAGLAVTGEFQVNAATANDQTDPAIAALQDGRFIIAWTDAGSASGLAIRARVFSAAGAPETEFMANLTNTGDQSEPAIAVLADGRVLVSWTDESAAFGDVSGSAIVGQIFDPRLAGVSLAGSELSDDFHGTGFADQLGGAAGDDVLRGDAGNDAMTGGAGADILDGGPGIDLADYSGSTAVNINLAANVHSGGDANGDSLILIESLTGSGFADFLAGSASANRIDGGGGADRMTGGLGNDIYFVEDALDRVIELADGGDDIVYSLASLILTANIERLVLTGAAAVNGRGNADANAITGNSSANALSGQEGNDTLSGGAGNDILAGGSGIDSFIGGAGIDVADYRLLGAILINLQTGAHGLDAAAETLTSIERVYGSKFGDDITGGGLGDGLSGFDGDDALAGGAGNDTLSGGAGADSITGGMGADRLTGGFDDDAFIYAALGESGPAGASRDLILDFEAGGDRIDLSAIDARAAENGVQSFIFIGSSAFSAEGQIRVLMSGAYTLVQVNTSGAGLAESVISLSGNLGLTQENFIL